MWLWCSPQLTECLAYILGLSTHHLGYADFVAHQCPDHNRLPNRCEFPSLAIPTRNNKRIVSCANNVKTLIGTSWWTLKKLVLNAPRRCKSLEAFLLAGELRWLSTTTVHMHALQISFNLIPFLAQHNFEESQSRNSCAFLWVSVIPISALYYSASICVFVLPFGSTRTVLSKSNHALLQWFTIARAETIESKDKGEEESEEEGEEEG